MRSRIISTLAISSLLLQTSVAFAKPDTNRVLVTNEHSGRAISIPVNAVELAPDVFSIGTDVVDGKVVEGIMFVHRTNNAKPDGVGGGKGGNGGGGDPVASCYSYLASGAKWKTPESWVLNPSNNSGLDANTLLAITGDVFQEWEDAANMNIMGNGSLTNSALIADEVSTDGVNEIYFGNIAEPGVIAVTITWGIFSGPPRSRELIEMDQVYDEVDYAWSTTGEGGKMDYENIAQHEVGHGIGMGHTATTAECLQQTMYPYADFAETYKRDLGVGDIAGVAALY